MAAPVGWRIAAARRTAGRSPQTRSGWPGRSWPALSSWPCTWGCSGLIRSLWFRGRRRHARCHGTGRRSRPASSLTLMDGDRTYAFWALLLGSGLRIGEMVSLRWPNVDLPRRRVHVVEFVSTLGYDLVSSAGKSRDATRSIDLDDDLVRILKAQRKLQSEERLASSSYVASDHVFTQLGGGSYHLQYLSRCSTCPGSWVGTPPNCSCSADGARPPAHQRDPDASPRSCAESRRRATGPRGPDPVHQPRQPRHADDAAQAANKIGAALFT